MARQAAYRLESQLRVERHRALIPPPPHFDRDAHARPMSLRLPEDDEDEEMEQAGPEEDDEVPQVAPEEEEEVTIVSVRRVGRVHRNEDDEDYEPDSSDSDVEILDTPPARPARNKGKGRAEASPGGPAPDAASTEPEAPRRLGCDRCHSRRRFCTWVQPTAQHTACEECRRLKRRCTVGGLSPRDTPEAVADRVYQATTLGFSYVEGLVAETAERTREDVQTWLQNLESRTADRLDNLAAETAERVLTGINRLARGARSAAVNQPRALGSGATARSRPAPGAARDRNAPHASGSGSGTSGRHHNAPHASGSGTGSSGFRRRD